MCCTCIIHLPTFIGQPIGHLNHHRSNEPSSFKDNSHHFRNMSQKKLMGGADDMIHVTDESQESYLELDNRE